MSRSPCTDDDLAAAEQGGGDVVGVAFYCVGEAEQLFQGQRPAEDQICGDHASGDGCGTAAESPAQGYLVVAGDSQGREFGTGSAVDGGDASIHHVIGARAQLSDAVTGNADGELLQTVRWIWC